MSGIFGHLNISDSDRVFNNTVGQEIIFDAVNDYINRINADLNAALGIFVENDTDKYKLRYKLPGGGSLQRRGSDGRYGAVKATGSWDVAFPLEDFGASVAWNDIDFRYLTVAELDRAVSTVGIQNVNTNRFEILKALLNSAEDTFVDPLFGSLLVEPLANGDSVSYPPVIGSETEATENHYLGSAYAASSISDTNNPFITIRDEIEEHFGVSGNGSNIVVFFNNAQRAKVEDLTDFDEVVDRFVIPGANTDIPMMLQGTYPGTLIGRVSGVWAVEWRWMPANYMFGIHLDAPKPLYRRTDPADTGLTTGLQLVARDQEFPFLNSFWRNRFGYGVANRLNGVAMDMSNTDSDYDVPTAYA